MIKRKIISKLENFYKSTEKAVLITGARQVGKTYAIRQFGKMNFSCFVEFNFLENLEARRIFSETRNVENFLLRISALSTVNLRKHDTLIFFDEVQECPELVTMLKFLVEEGSYRYILSGSLLGVELKDIRSIPVGFLSIEEMFPLDFEEFAKAVNLSDEVWNYLKKSYNERTKVDDVIHRRILQLFRMYLSVGGMPAVVDEYENVVAQELRAHGFKLFYFNSKRQGELNFVVEYNNQVLPIEVKSGKDYKRHSALSNVLCSSQYNISHAIVFSNGNLERVGAVDYLPVYMVSFLQIEETPDVQVKNNFSDILLPSV